MTKHMEDECRRSPRQVGSGRGREFEEDVLLLLRALEETHPDLIEIRTQPKLELENGTEVIPDFELAYRLPHEMSRRLIECQDRQKSSHDLVRKIEYIKLHSPWNRVVFVYRDQDFLSDPVAQALEASGVLFYSLVEFAAMLVRLSKTIEAANTVCYKVYSRETDASVCSSATSPVPGGTGWKVMLIGAILCGEYGLVSLHDESNEREVAVSWPRTTEYLRRILGRSRKKRQMGVGFADEVVEELSVDRVKEEVLCERSRMQLALAA